MKKSFLAVAALLVLQACSSTPKTTPSEPVNAMETNALRLYALECGRIEVQDISVFHPGIGQGQVKTLTDTCYLIVHPKGTLLWDAGLPDELVKTPEGKTVHTIFKLTVTKTLESQLKEIGVAPQTINYLGISHMHFDHIGNANLLPSSTLLMQKEEYDAAFGPTPDKFGFDPTTYPTLRRNPAKKLTGDYDVFGDGSVTIKRALGHTPGHQALFLRLPKTGNILLSGDLVHFTENWEHKYVPAFNFDKEKSVKTMEDIESFLKDNKATLWIQHDLEQNAGIKHSPAFYE